MKMRKVLSALLVAACTLSLAACGSSSSKSETTGASGETAAGSANTAKVIDVDLTSEEYAFGVDKTQPELLEQTNTFIQKIKDDGTLDAICAKYFGDGEPEAVESAELDSSKDQLVVATNAAFEPFEYTKGDQYYGIDMEIAKLLADKLGKELVIVDMAFDAVLLSVQQQKADIGMAGLTVNPSRAKQVDFSDSYYSASQKVICKADDTTFDNCKTKEDVDKILKSFDSSVLIGGQTGTTGQSYVQGNDEFGFEKLGATWKGYANGSLAVQDLINGGIKYVIIDAAPAQAITNAINAVA